MSWPDGISPLEKGGWYHKPYIQDKVIDVLRNAAGPLTLREVMNRADINKMQANRALRRLVFEKKMATRFQLPINRPMSTKRYTGPTTRLTYLYLLNEADGDE